MNDKWSQFSIMNDIMNNIVNDINNIMNYIGHSHYVGKAEGIALLKNGKQFENHSNY